MFQCASVWQTPGLIVKTKTLAEDSNKIEKGLRCLWTEHYCNGFLIAHQSSVAETVINTLISLS